MTLPGKASRNEMEPEPSREESRSGRPRRWASEAEKHRAHRVRKAEKAALLEALLHAVRNAALDDAQLQRVVNEGDDAAVLRELIAYYRARNWNLTGWGQGKPPMAEEP